MTEKNILFFNVITRLSDEELIAWIKKHHLTISYAPKAPFENVYDSMDVLQRTINLLNEFYTLGHVAEFQSRFENKLVEVFGEELNAALLRADIVHKYVSIFTDSPLKGTAKAKLVAILKPVVLNQKFITVRVGARNLYYDIIQLLVEQFNGENQEFLEYNSISDFLVFNLKGTKSARLANICLTYFRNTHLIKKFFYVVNYCFKEFREDELTDIIDMIVSLYKRYQTLSWGFFANWLLHALSSPATSGRMKFVYNHDRLSRLIAKRWNQYFELAEINQSENTKYLTALIILFRLSISPKAICPEHLRLFFVNAEDEETAQDLLSVVKQESIYFLSEADFYQVLYDSKVGAYYKFHLAVLLNIVRFTNGDPEELDIEYWMFEDQLNENNLFVDIDFSLQRILIENTGYLPDFDWQWPKSAASRLTIPLSKMPTNVNCWQLLESIINVSQL